MVVLESVNGVDDVDERHTGTGRWERTGQKIGLGNATRPPGLLHFTLLKSSLLLSRRAFCLSLSLLAQELAICQAAEPLATHNHKYDDQRLLPRDHRCARPGCPARRIVHPSSLHRSAWTHPTCPEPPPRPAPITIQVRVRDLYASDRDSASPPT